MKIDVKYSNNETLLNFEQASYIVHLMQLRQQFELYNAYYAEYFINVIPPHSLL